MRLKLNTTLYKKVSAFTLMFAISLIYLLFSTPSNAIALTLDNNLPFTVIGKGATMPVAEFKGTLYIPKPGGLYMYNKGECTKIYEGSPNHVSVSPDGEFLVFSEMGSIKTLNLASSEVKEILKGDNETLFYDEPSWLPDNMGILFTKVTISDKPNKDNSLKTSYIYMLDLTSMKKAKLSEGMWPSYVKSKNAIVFERDSKIVYKSLKDNYEEIIDEGSTPTASPNGKYIAYIKVTSSVTGVKPKVQIEEHLQNIWTVKVKDFSKKKQITSNKILKTIDKKTWLKELKPSEALQILSLSGKYAYLYPSWSSDSKDIYSIVRVYPEPKTNERIESYLIKIPAK